MPAPIAASSNRVNLKLLWILNTDPDPAENTLKVLDGIRDVDNDLKAVQTSEYKHQSNASGYYGNLAVGKNGTLTVPISVLPYDEGYQELVSHIGDQDTEGYELYVIYTEEELETAKGRFIAQFKKTLPAMDIITGDLTLMVASVAPTFTSDLPDLTPVAP